VLRRAALQSKTFQVSVVLSTVSAAQISSCSLAFATEYLTWPSVYRADFACLYTLDQTSHFQLPMQFADTLPVIDTAGVRSGCVNEIAPPRPPLRDMQLGRRTAA